MRSTVAACLAVFAALPSSAGCQALDPSYPSDAGERAAGSNEPAQVGRARTTHSPDKARQHAPASGRSEAPRRTSPFWRQEGADIRRFDGRLFVGGAAANDGAYPNVSQDWLADLQTAWGHSIGYTSGGLVNILTGNSTSAAYAIIGGAQTRHFDRPSAAIGSQGYGICNNSSTAGNCWGFYGEVHRMSGAGSAYAMEIDPVGHIESIRPSPNQQGNLIGQQIACGGEYARITQYPCSAAIQIAPNGAPFHTGLNVIAGAISKGSAAIQLPTGNGIGFYAPTGHGGGMINANFTAGTTSNLMFTDHGLQIAGTDGSAVAYFHPLHAGTNYLVFGGNSRSEAPYVAAEGQDADVNLSLSGKGKGVVSARTGLQLIPGTFAALPPCNAVNQGTIAYITDARVPITSWHQEVAAGNGSNKAFITCNGNSWHAFDY